MPSIEEKLWNLVTRLLQKTRLGELNWEATAERTVYQLSFPKYTVRLWEAASQQDVEANDFVIAVYNEMGKQIEKASDVALADATGSSDVSAFQAMKELHDLARHRALGVDDALDSLLSSLDETGL